MTTSNVTTTTTRSTARALLTRARFTQDEHGHWSAPNGHQTWAAEEVQSWALLTLAENWDHK